MSVYMNFKYVIVLFILVLVSSVSFVSATDSSFSEIDNANLKVIRVYMKI